MPDVVLVADDDPDIVRFVELNLELEGFTVVVASDGEEALELARKHQPGLIILDVMMPKMDGFEVCQKLREDRALSDVNIIMLTAKTMSADRVHGLTSGADDYISKPFDPTELVVRVKNAMRRSRAMRSSSPLTGLPGNVQIDEELRRRVELGTPFALLWLDLDNFKAFNDAYGFSRGDEAITFLAQILQETTQDRPDAFIGHIGGDDFVVVCADGEVDELSATIIERFDAGIRSLYDPEDAARGFVLVADRRGDDAEHPIVTVSIGVASTADRRFIDHRELVERATEMKSVAKDQAGSVVAKDRRHDGS